MREINAKDITEQVKRLCMEANSYLPEDIKERINKSEQEEPWALAKNILGIIHENYLIAEENYVPVCQDTGMACVFMEIGQDVHINGNLEEAVNEGVRQGYTEGCLRKSVVRDPLDRVNTTDNTPAMIYYDVGIGGTFDKAALLAKKALMRNTNVRNADPFYADLEEEMLQKINALGIGPQGVGGKTTALAVNIEKMPTHIAGLPIAVNINCHVTRHKTVEL